jgi:ribose transport system ATP-binding protein
MEEICRIADRVTVLRDGEVVDTVDQKSTSISKIVTMVLGKELAKGIKRPEIEKGEEVLAVKDLGRRDTFKNICFKLKEGEIIGIGGLVGSGRTEVARCIFGADRPTSGVIKIRGKEISIKSPEDAISKGIVLIPEDRKLQGLNIGQSVRQNLSIAILRFISKLQFINLKKREEIVKDMVSILNIKTPDLDQEVNYLSGGNQQKVVVGKWLAIDPKIFILDQPTRGIDVGAKQEIYNLIIKLAQKGSSVILISDEISELINLSDRIIVMRKGEMIQEFNRDDVSEHRLLVSILGQNNNKN